MPIKKTYFVTMQDGIIREEPASFSNFHQFEVNLTDFQKEELQELLYSDDVKKQYEYLYSFCIEKDKNLIKKLGF